jgi:hypothetical protein
MSRRVNDDPILIAAEIVQLQAMDDNPHLSRVPNVSVVWFCYILGGWKALLISDQPDERYYEVTFDKAKSRVYLDTYMKKANSSIALADIEEQPDE